jgi:FlaA1/EpsC-like NDP-sugar epimerase
MKRLFDKILNWYFTKNSLPYWSILLIDCLIIVFSAMSIYWLFHQADLLAENFPKVLLTSCIFVLLSFPGFRIFHTYSGFMRFSSFVDLMRVTYCNLVSLVLVLICMWGVEQLPVKWLNWFMPFTTRQIVLIFIISTLLMWALRIFVKTLYDQALSNTKAERALIYGALSGGVGLAKNINSVRPRRFVLKGFISHSDKMKHHTLMGEPVFNTDEDIAKIIKERDIRAVLVAPSRVDDFRNNQALQDIIIGAGAKIYMTTIAKEMNTEDVNSMQDADMHIHEVSVEELLPRDEIRVDMKSLGEMLTGTTVFITGAAGSIGSEIVRQVAAYKPAHMILIDQAETPMHDVRLMMAKEFPDVQALTIVTSISRKTRMDTLFKRYKPDYVFHAAAYKHVPMMEDNPSEAVLNNIYGTKVIADTAVRYGVKKFVMVSTDKAVNPTNVMGCSKRICEIYVQSLDQAIKQKKINAPTQFVTTRFGNVLGSNGSVIPLFREQIKRGGPLTVTDERIVRFFMLIPEACKLVLEAGVKGNGGEIFVFDMGQPVKIIDLAKRMIKLSGAKNVEIEITGLRPGEKLYEEVLNELEGTKPTFHEKIRIAQVREYDYEQVRQAIDDLVELSKQYDNMATVKKMKEIVPEYKSKNSEYEVLDQA